MIHLKILPGMLGGPTPALATPRRYKFVCSLPPPSVLRGIVNNQSAACSVPPVAPALYPHPISSKAVANLCQVWLTSDQCSPTLGHIRPSLAHIGPTYASIGHRCTRFGQHPSNFAKRLAEFWRSAFGNFPQRASRRSSPRSVRVFSERLSKDRRSAE